MQVLMSLIQFSLTFMQASLSHEEPGPSSSSSENQEIVRMPEKQSENQDHASPTSILDAPFKDEANENAPNSSKFPNSDNPRKFTTFFSSHT